MRRIDYTRFDIPGPRTGGGSPAGLQRVADMLSAAWMDAYHASCPEAEVVSVKLDTFDYLFDMTAERNLAASGIMVGRNTAVRDHARMAGHPKSEGKDYHRGHMIPHSGHGGTDINLFSQLGSVNVGRFRRLEKLAVANPGSFYFVRMIYDDAKSQRPSFVEQGLLLPASGKIDFETFAN